MREAEESGRRQRELVLRAQAQETFRQVMAVHRSSAASFINEITTQVVTIAAKNQADAEARRNHL